MPRDHNRLIELLPGKERTRFLTNCRSVELVPDEVLGVSGEATRYVYFPMGGVIAVLTPMAGNPVLEVSMVGNEGMLGSQLVLGVENSPYHALVRGTGRALRIAAAPFRHELARSTALRVSLNRYVCATMIHLASSVACHRFHLIAPRLARWLLMTQDRAHSDRFHITHESLAFLLGVRRVSITTAAGVLQRQGLIQYHRGELRVTDRRGLEAAACSCYAADQKIYLDLLQ